MYSSTSSWRRAANINFYIINIYVFIKELVAEGSEHQVFIQSIYMYSLTYPHELNVTQGQFLSGLWHVWIQNFYSIPVLIPRLKSPVRPTIYAQLEREYIWLTLFEMQTTSSRIWTHVSVSISYDDNRYFMSASLIHIQIRICFGLSFFLYSKYSVLNPWINIDKKQ